MNELRDLLEMIDVPPTDPAADVARGHRALRRRRRVQVSAAALSVVAVAGLGLGVRAADGPDASKSPGFASATPSPHPSVTLPPAHQQPAWMSASPPTPPIDLAHDYSYLWRVRAAHIAADTVRAYRAVLVEHLDRHGAALGPANGSGGTVDSFLADYAWLDGGRVTVLTAPSWPELHWGFHAPAPGETTTYDGRPARVLEDGGDLYVAVERTDGDVTMVMAEKEFPNNHTSIPATGLTQAQLLATAADPALVLPDPVPDPGPKGFPRGVLR